MSGATVGKKDVFYHAFNLNCRLCEQSVSEICTASEKTIILFCFVLRVSIRRTKPVCNTSTEA